MQPAGSEIADPLRLPGYVEIVKHTIGAFHATGLQTELESRGVEGLVFGGIMTNMGVESSVRAASDFGWDDNSVVEDACAALSLGEHQASIGYTLPRFAEILRPGQARP